MTGPSNSSSTPLAEAVSRALKGLLRPLARLMIRHGLTLPAVVELLKQALVEVVDQQLPVDGKRTTDSRISVLTGVHRKDVKRLRDVEQETVAAPRQLALGARLVNTWLTEPAWQDKKGNPRALARTDEGDVLGFDTLASQLSNDVRPRAVLDELLRTGVVEINDDGKVKLARQAYVPGDAEEEKLVYFEQAGVAHLMAGVENLEGHKPAHFDRIVHYKHIPADAVEKLREHVNKDGMQLLKGFNSKAKRMRREEAPDGQRIYMGVYFFHERDDADSGDQS